MTEQNKDRYSRWFVIGILAACFLLLTFAGLSWGAIIGNSTIEATNVSSFPGRGFATASLTAGNNDGIYTAVTDDIVDTLVWYGDWGTDGTDLIVEMGIYTVVDDSVPDVLIDSSSVTVNSGTKQFWAVVVNIPLTNGVKYIYTWVARNSHSYEGRRASCTDCTGQSLLSGAALASPWSGSGADFGIVFTGYANVTNTPSGVGNKVMILNE